jgi:hypothetical protein
VGDHRIACCTSEGACIIFDSADGATLLQKSLASPRNQDKPSSFRIAWCPSDTEMIALSFASGCVILIDSKGKELQTFAHPAAAFGVAFSPHQPPLLATGCDVRGCTARLPRAPCCPKL